MYDDSCDEPDIIIAGNGAVDWGLLRIELDVNPLITGAGSVSNHLRSPFLSCRRTPDDRLVFADPDDKDPSEVLRHIRISWSIFDMDGAGVKSLELALVMAGIDFASGEVATAPAFDATISNCFKTASFISSGNGAGSANVYLTNPFGTVSTSSLASNQSMNGKAKVEGMQGPFSLLQRAKHSLATTGPKALFRKKRVPFEKCS